MKRFCVFLLLFVFSLSVFILPAVASDPSSEIERLKGEIQKIQDNDAVLLLSSSMKVA